MQLVTYDVEEKKPSGFGINNRYSLRNRIPCLRKELGERPIYVYSKNGPELIAIERVPNPCAGFNYIINQAKYQMNEKIIKKKKSTKDGEIILEENSLDYSSEGTDNEENKGDGKNQKKKKKKLIKGGKVFLEENNPDNERKDMKDNNENKDKGKNQIKGGDVILEDNEDDYNSNEFINI